jgi:rhodanese-related sulfurtransferase
MPRMIGLAETRSLLEERNAALAEVLPRPEYDWAHLPGAIHLPLKDWDPEEVRSTLGAEGPIITYCNDLQ